MANKSETAAKELGWFDILGYPTEFRAGRVKDLQEQKEAIKSLGLALDEQGNLVASTPDGRREVKFSSVNGTRVIAYQIGEKGGVPMLKVLPLPFLKKEIITRGPRAKSKKDYHF